MAVMAAIAVADGASTPVTHTFNPVTDNPPEWSDSDAGVSFKYLQYRIKVQQKRANGSNGMNRVVITLTTPKGGDGVTVPANEVARFGTVKMEFLLPAKGTKQERKDLRTLAKNLLADAQIIDIVDELNSAW